MEEQWGSSGGVAVGVVLQLDRDLDEYVGSRRGAEVVDRLELRPVWSRSLQWKDRVFGEEGDVSVQARSTAGAPLMQQGDT